MQRHGHGVADQHIQDAGGWGGQRAVNDAVAEPRPEDEIAGDLEIAVPPCQALAGALAVGEEQPRLHVQVEAAEHQDQVVEVRLVGHEALGQLCVRHQALVVGGEETSEKAVVDG